MKVLILEIWHLIWKVHAASNNQFDINMPFKFKHFDASWSELYIRFVCLNCNLHRCEVRLATSTVGLHSRSQSIVLTWQLLPPGWASFPAPMAQEHFGMSGGVMATLVAPPEGSSSRSHSRPMRMRMRMLLQLQLLLLLLLYFHFIWTRRHVRG